ncbi:MAG: error-prone DNA polymerase, partial [Alphaproteobacteria bacterium]
VEPAPAGRTPQEELARLTWLGAAKRYPFGVPEKIRATIEKELALIAQLDYAPYFITVYDIVSYARSRTPAILCQGRGSAANSAVCYCLGITAVDPDKMDLLFERFVSAARKEPPDIDVDFEHERREEVIQYIYNKYTRERAGLAATVISYRPRSAIREVGKVLGLSDDITGALAKNTWGWSDDEEFRPAHIREIGLDPDDRTLMLAISMARELMGFPRHLSQHVGGFVITRSPLCELVPIENAAMEDRTVVEWDKDDLDELRMLKIDVLALGMLTCIRKAFDLLRMHYGKNYELATVPQDDPAVYDMLCRADSVGVFQVESRAQMTMLPRLKPRTMYDLVIEVAIVRPGPIQGDMVHPYLRRRNGEEAVHFPSEELRQVLGKTLGVPLFQEQAMRIAIVAAGFTPDEADLLRRAMATFRKTGTIHGFHTKMVDGMVARGYERDFAERCFKQIEGFGEYGFPESHAASFALLVYISAWLKCHYPAAFGCAILNSQPMGFYAPAQLVRDARDHDVEVLPVDVNRSVWDNALEPGGDGKMALRLGFRQGRGLREADIAKLVAARGNAYADPVALWKKSGLKPAVLERIARADAFASLGLSRREALWSVKGLGDKPLALFEAANEEELANEPAVALPEMPLGEQVVEDYATLRLSLKAHPLGLLRPRMSEAGVIDNAALNEVAADDFVSVAGLVIVRQRPGTAKGVIFMTLEDERGICNIIVWPHVLEKFRRIVLTGRLVKVTGQLQREGLVTHIVAHRLFDLSDHLDGLSAIDAPFDNALARADEVARPGRDHRDKAVRRAPSLDVMYPSRDFH